MTRSINKSIIIATVDLALEVKTYIDEYLYPYYLEPEDILEAHPGLKWSEVAKKHREMDTSHYTGFYQGPSETRPSR